MTWMLTPTGAEYHLHGPDAMTDAGQPVDAWAVAHQLSLINRFHGATVRPYSVAEHSLLCSEIAERLGRSVHVQLAALWHDAHECVTQDLSSPAKIAVNALASAAGGTSAWTLFETAHAKRFRRALGLETVFVTMRAVLQRIDLQALATERRDLTAYNPDHSQPWAVLHDADPAERIEPIDWLRLDSPERVAMTWQDWRQAFIDRLESLQHAQQLLQGRAC
ncbi:hypothetical protein NS331_22600 [Pseudacidovorax intermedius]|uniref:Phosphohydrolase n=2 Tax=Pseudacidovorax intermedius TaxID=433924 RepID=A0A147GMJ8_9BURK|nr:hypothetical protein NS331_22600 [Pseudacidovorax intermedius]